MKTKRTYKEIQKLLAQAKSLLLGIYGERLVSVILYGSFARNQATLDSDIDLAVILKGKLNKADEIEKIQEVISLLSLESDELVSVNPISKEELQDTEWPLYDHIRNEGIRL